eukprot:257898_1
MQIVLSIIIVLYNINVIIATDISGTVSVDYTFTVANSPYYIQEPATFTKNVIIENGAEIIFSSNYNIGIEFQGNVIAGCNDINTENNNNRGLMNSNTFTYIHVDDPTFNRESGSVIIKSTTPSNTQIEFCNVKFSGLYNALLHHTTTDPNYSIPLLIDNCEFSNNINTMVTWYYARASITAYFNDTIISNTRVVNFYGDAIYDNCDIRDYDKFCDSSCNRFALRNSYISRNETDSSSSSNCLGSFVNSFIGDEKLAMYNNVISNCGTGIRHSNSVSPWIVNNTFTNIHHRAIYSSRNMYLIDNVFVNNNLKSLLYLTWSPNMTIKGNQFIDNIGNSVSDSLIYITAENFLTCLTIKDNILVNNQAAGRLMTIAARKTFVLNNVFIKNVAAVSSVPSLANIIGDTAAIHFSSKSSNRIHLTFTGNSFVDNTWNSYFIYTDPDEVESVDIEFNTFNDLLIAPTAKLLSLGGHRITVKYNVFIPPIVNNISAIVEILGKYGSYNYVQYNNFYNSFTSILFIENVANPYALITNNYFDGLIDVEQILAKINSMTFIDECNVIEPFYKDPIDMDYISNLPTECLLDSAYLSNCSYDGNIIGCISITTVNVTQPATNGITWEFGDYPLPQRVSLAPAFSVDDNIAYLFDVRGDVIFKLDTTVINPSWQTLPVMLPFDAAIDSGHQAVKIGSLIYFYHYFERIFYIFDCTTDAFLNNSHITLSPYYKSGNLAIVTDNKYIYTIGGQGVAFSKYVEQYDIANNAWNLLSTNAPFDKWFWLNTIYYSPQNRIYVFGGFGNTAPFTDIYYFDLNTKTWSNSIGTINIVSYDVVFSPTVYIPEIDTIYIISGQANEVNIYDPVSNIITTETSDTPQTVCGDVTWASAITLNNRLQIFGGTNCRTIEELYMYDSSSKNNTLNTTEPGIVDSVDLVRFTQNYQYMYYELNQGLFMKSNDDTFYFFLDSTFNQVDALNGEIDCYSFHSIHYADQYIGHNLVNNETSLSLYVADVTNVDNITWCHIPALNGKGGMTWFPFGYTQYYMTKQAQSDMIMVGNNDGSTQFKDDASFHMWQFDPIAF